MKNKRGRWAYAAILIFSCAFFLCFYGVKCLNPCYVDWLLSGGLDISQHYAGWLFFRKEPWTFPVGYFYGLSYPNPMSIVYMDSIPLLAVFFKLFQPLLPAHFQYFGWYGLLCVLLQGILGVKLAAKYSKSATVSFLAGTLAVMTPAFLWRMFLHTALASHWILLLALIGIVYYEEYFKGKHVRSALFWAMIGFLCCTVHLYFLPMCFIILCAFLYLDARCMGLRGRRLCYAFAGFWCGVWIPACALGVFLPGMTVSDLDFTWKKTFNLNAFFNPQGWSRILPKLPLHTYGQSEGFAYLGLGILLIVFVSGLLVVYYLWGGGEREAACRSVCTASRRRPVWESCFFP